MTYELTQILSWVILTFALEALHEFCSTFSQISEKFRSGFHGETSGKIAGRILGYIFKDFL